jgi:2-methylcitrate dehydratase PrpD
MAATQALKELLAQDVSAAAVKRISAAVLPPHQKMIDHGVSAGDRFSHLTSLPYQMALAALRPDNAYSIGCPVGPTDPELASFMERINIGADEGLRDLGYPKSWAARVIVETASDRRERTVTHVPGDPARPFGEAESKAKFRRVTASVIDGTKADAIFASALAALDDPAALLAEVAQIAAGGG